MGVNKKIGIDKFPKQAEKSCFGGVGTRISVCFNYDTSKTLKGVTVRDDREEPFRTIIRLEDGRYVLATECQYSAID